MRAKDALPVPTENDEQKALMRWAKFNMGRWPDLRMLLHIPNEGRRDPRTGYALKQMGLRKGFPDLLLLTPRGTMHGLAIEMKRTKGGKVSAEQAQWIADLVAQGYAACVCYGWEAAAREIERYMTEGK